MKNILKLRRFFYFLVPFTFLVVNFTTGVQLGMKDAVPGARDRQIFYIAAAISSVVYGIHGYVANDLVERTLIDHGMGPPAGDSEASRIAHFTDAVALDTAVKTAVSLPPAEVKSAPYSILVYEDIGYAQFLDWAYRIFGGHISSAYYGYFLILGISVFVFFLFPPTTEALCLAIVSIVLAAHWTLLPAIAHVSEALTVTNARFFGMLVVLPLTYILCAIFRGFSLRSTTTIGVSVQCAIIGFVPFIRMSSMWAIILLVAVTTALTCRWLLRRGLWRDPFRSMRPSVTLQSAWVACFMTLVFLGATQILDITHSAPSYRQSGVGYHTFWDNAFTGLEQAGWNEQFACIYGGGLSDYVAFSAAERQLRADGLPESVWQQNGNIKPKYYNSAIRKVYLSFLWNHPLFAAKVYFYERPGQFYRHFSRLWHDGLRDTVFSYIPLTITIALAIFVIFSNISLRTWARGMLLLVPIWLMSAFPEFLAGAAEHLLAETAVLSLAVVYGIVLFCLAVPGRALRLWLAAGTCAPTQTVATYRWEWIIPAAMVLFLASSLAFPSKWTVTVATATSPKTMPASVADFDDNGVSVVNSIFMPRPPSMTPILGHGRFPATVEASSSFSEQNGPDQLFSDQPDTYWQIGPPPEAPEEWLSIDLGAAKAASASLIRMQPRPDGPREFFSSARLDTSDDGKNWVPLAKLVTSPYPINSVTWLAWNLPPHAAYRYYKFTFPQTGRLEFCSIGKLEMY